MINVYTDFRSGRIYDVLRLVLVNPASTNILDRLRLTMWLRCQLGFRVNLEIGQPRNFDSIKDGSYILGHSLKGRLEEWSQINTCRRHLLPYYSLI